MSLECMWSARRKYPPRFRLRLLRSWRGRQLDFKKVVCKRGFRPSSIGFRQTQLRFSSCACPWNACGLRGGSIRHAFVCASRAHGADGSLILRRLYANGGSPPPRLIFGQRAITPFCTPCMSLRCVWSGAMRRAFARNYGYFSAPLQNSRPICPANPAFPPAARQASSVDAPGNTFALLAHLARPRRWARGPLWHPKA